MNIQELLAEAKAFGISLEVEGENLLVRGKNSVLNAEFVRQLKANKKEIIAFLSEDKAVCIADTSFGQRRLWLANNQSGNSSIFNITICCNIPSGFEIKQLKSAFTSLAKRHEILRTGFNLIEGEIKQIILPIEQFEFDVTDNRLDPETRDIRDSIKEDAHHRFDLKHPPLFKASVYLNTENTMVLVIVLHHIVTDAWSLPILMRDLTAFYFSEGEKLPVPVSQYRDYVEWMNNFTKKEAFTSSRDYWRNRFSDLVPIINIPTDFERGAQKSNEGKVASRSVSPANYSRWKHFLVQHGYTEFIGSLAMVYVLLHKYCDTTDLVIGTAVGGRPTLSFVDTIGFFVNTLPLRARVDPATTINKLLAQVKDIVLDGLKHQMYPFDSMVEDLRIAHSRQRHPLYDVAVVFHNDTADSAQESFNRIQRWDPGFRAAPTDLRFEFIESKGSLQINLDYDASLFKEARIEFILEHMQKLIVDFSVAEYEKRLDSLSVLSTREKEVLNRLSSINPLTFTNDILNTRFERCAKEHELLPAIYSREGTLTYGELLRATEDLAAHMINTYGVKKNDIIAVNISGSANAIISMLAIWNCGAVYLPIDPGLPQKRVSFFLEDSRAILIITESAYLNDLVESGLPLIALDVQSNEFHSSENWCRPTVEPKDPAYLIYTSGSTGAPKGVLVHHTGCLNMALSQIEIFGIEHEHDKVALFASVSFDASISEMLMALLSGAPLMIISEDMKKDPLRLFAYLKENEATVITLPPSYLRVLNKNLLQPLTKLILAGESLHQGDIAEVPDHIRIFNAYGPTETSVCASIFEVRRSDLNANRIPIGRPIRNIGISICDENFLPVPIGTLGQICIAGEGLALGYMNNEVLTAERFRQIDCFGNMYLTGDIGVITLEGVIEYVGRKDQQVKLNGFRVELDEIVECVNCYRDIQHCTVIYLDTIKLLVAVFTATEVISITGLKNFLQKRLPHYMIPAVFEQWNHLPITSSGKVDRNVVRDQFIEHLSAEQFQAPLDEKLVELAEVWQVVLGKQAISDCSNFFELGGDSIRAIELVTLLNERYKIEIDITDLFAYPKMSDFYSNVLENAKAAHSNIERVSVRDFYHLSEGQLRLWMLHQIDEKKYAYNLPNAYRIRGPVDYTILRQSFDHLIKRHEALRTQITLSEGVPYQKIVEADLMKYEIKQIDFSAVDRIEEKVRKVVESEACHVFDLGVAPLWQVCLLKQGKDDFVLTITIHHLIGDAWSFAILVRELLVVYNSIRGHVDPGLPPIKYSYKDVVEWRRKDSSGKEKSRAYWLQKFNDIPERLDLKYDFTRPATKTYDGGYCRFKVDGELLHAIKNFAIERDISLFPLLVSSINVLLYSYSQKEDIVLGMPYSGRDSSATQSIIGFFINTVPLRTKFKKTWTVDRFIGELNKTYQEAYKHQDYGFYQLIKDLNLKRDASRYPLFDVWVVLQNANIKEEALDLPFDIGGTDFDFDICKYDLKFDFNVGDDDADVFLIYSRDLFVLSTIETMCRDFLFILQAMTVNPNQSIDAIRSALTDANSVELDFRKIKKRQL